MPKQRTPLRREEILSTAVDQLRARGVGSLRATDVAKALGVSSGLIFYHFESKDQLIAEAFTFAVDRGLSELRQIVAGEGSAIDRMTRAVSLYGPDDQAHGWRIWLDGWSESLRNEPLRQTIVRLDDAWEDTFRGLVAEGVAEGVFDVDDPDVTAKSLMSLLDGTAVQAVVRGDSDRAHARRAASARTVVAMLGMSTDDAASMLTHLSLAH